MAKTKVQNEELILSYVDAINDRDWRAIEDVLAADVVRHGVGEPTRGPKALIEENRAFIEAFPDLRDTIEDVVAEGDKVACRITTTGTHEGVFQDIDPTGEEFEISSLTVFRIEDDELTEIWAQVDMLGLLDQLGVVEQPGE